MQAGNKSMWKAIKEQTSRGTKSNLVLTPDIPNCEADVLVFDCLYIKSYRERRKLYQSQ